jgi:hypothetical protein
MATRAIQTSQHTHITHELPFDFNAPHHFQVHSGTIDQDNSPVITKIDFQKGPIKEAGVNGTTNEDLLHMVRLRLEGFQNSEFKSDDNQKALDHIVAAIEALERRTKKRMERGVEGTHVI